MRGALSRCPLSPFLSVLVFVPCLDSAAHLLWSASRNIWLTSELLIPGMFTLLSAIVFSSGPRMPILLSAAVISWLSIPPSPFPSIWLKSAFSSAESSTRQLCVVRR